MKASFAKTFTERSTRMVVATIITSEGLIEIFHCADSGKVITREKIDTITKVFHPGIIIGVDARGRMWVAHNHYLNKRPTFDLITDFAQSKEVIFDYRRVNYNTDEIVKRAIKEVQKGKTYGGVNYNCQTFVNIIVRDEHSSEAVDRITDGGIAAGLILALFGAVTKSKGLFVAGTTLASVSGAAKGYSRMKL